MEEGAFLGSEDELLALLGVSRPTFRQAAKLIQQEQLLTIKRGVGGGFFVRRPSADAVTHMTAVYLQSRKATLQDAIQASLPLFEEGARLAARRRDPAVCARFSHFLKREEHTIETAPDDFRAFLRSEREFGIIFASASGNPLLELYLLVLYEFSATLHRQSLFYKQPKRLAAYRALRDKLAMAILDGDEEVALVLARRSSEFTASLIGPPSPRNVRNRFIRVLDN